MRCGRTGRRSCPASPARRRGARSSRAAWSGPSAGRAWRETLGAVRASASLGLLDRVLAVARERLLARRSARRRPPRAAAPPAPGTRSSAAARSGPRVRRRPQQRDREQRTRRRPSPSPRGDRASTTRARRSVTGRMNASSSEVVAPASTELTTPGEDHREADDRHRQRRQPHALRERACRGTTNARPRRASAACACRRSRIGPPKSTSSSIANEPNAANVATTGLPITLSPSANIAGITIAARPARRSAARSRSRRPSHCSGWSALTPRSVSPPSNPRSPTRPRRAPNAPPGQASTASRSSIASTRSG